MAAESQELAILVTARDLASRTLGKVNKSLSSIGSHARRGVSNAVANLKRLGMVGAGVVGGLAVASIKFASDWESAAAGVRKTVEGNVDDILVGIRALAREIPIGAEELAGLAEAAGALGVKKADILEFTRVTALMGVTTDVTADAAAESFGKIGTVVGLTGKEYERFASQVVALGNDGASTESAILGITERIAGAGKTVGIAKKDLAAWGSAAANIGMRTEAAGSNLSTFFITMFRNIETGGPLLEDIAKTAGMTGKEFRQAYQRDASGALSTFMMGLADLDAATRFDVMGRLGLTGVRMNTLMLGLSSNTENLNKALRTGRSAWRDNNAMTDEAAKRFETFDSRVAVLRNNLRDVGITFGTALLPSLNKVVKKFNEWLSDPEQQANLVALAEDVGKEFDNLVTKASEFVGTIDWESLVSSLQQAVSLSSQIASKALELFNSAPDWLKTAVITGWGLNKLTGGAFGTIVGELGKGLIKGVLGITAGVVNVMGGAIKGPGGISPPVVAGGSRLGGMAGAALGATAVLTPPAIAGFIMGELTKDDVHDAVKSGVIAAGPLQPTLEGGLNTQAGLVRIQQDIVGDIADFFGLRDAENQRNEALRNEALRRDTRQGAATTSAAVRETTRAVNAQDLSVAVNTTVNTHVSARDVAAETTRTILRTGHSQVPV